MKVSVVVPVYNVENYILRALESLKNQTYKNFEVIVINDGSTDNSGKIAKDFCEKYSSLGFKYFSHENKGLGLTRNRGIQLSSGDYIMFLDSDDTFEESAIENMVTAAVQKNADIVCGEIRIVYNGTKKNYIQYSNDHVADMINVRENLGLFYKNYYFTNIYTHHAWDKIYRLDIIKENDIYFGENKKIFSEDNYFQLQLIHYVDKISFINQPIYNYLQRDGSIMNSFKENVASRQMTLVNSFQGRYSWDKNFDKVLSLLSMQAIVAETLNFVSVNKTFKEYRAYMIRLRSDNYVKIKLSGIYSLKSYRLISNKNKYNFYKIMGWLAKNNLFFCFDLLFYIYYKLRRKNEL